MRVKCLRPYEWFIQGRDVSNALHREDGSAGYIVGEVDEKHSGDVPIDDAEYERLAAEIRTYNSALPPLPPPPHPNASLLAEVANLSGISPQVKSVLQKLVERMR